MDKYEFDEKKHIHTLNGKALTGVTTILGVIAKPMLIQWSANEAVKLVASKWMPDVTYSKSDIDDILDEAKVAHRKKKEDAGAKGTDIHAEVEKIIKKAIESKSGKVEDYLGDNNEQIMHFVTWAMANNVVFRASEEHIYSKTLHIGGICDIICEVDGEVWLADIKTGSGIYPEAFWQMAAYQMCIEEMGLQQNIKGHIVLNLRKTGEFEEKRSISNEDNKKAFLACLDIYRIQQKVKGTLLS